ncbi:MAG: hypothetical protein MMC23_008898 [Stictis urceolatum]|nr:hypothetical protein [Stictis urceolata]
MSEKVEHTHSDRSPSDDETRVGGNKAFGTMANLPPDPDEGLSDAEKAKIDRKLLWKLDLKLIPWLSLLYLVSFLDRTNIGNARLAGLETDLKITDSQYLIALTVFFISYSVFEPLTNVMLKRFKPSIFIPAIMLAWGICTTCLGLTHNFSGLTAARFFVGLAEAGLFPGIQYYLSCWYKRSEFGIRSAIFFSGAALAGSFGGLLAYGIEQMAGIGGKGGWAWIFIIEGLFTVVIAVASFWMVHDFPDDAKFLSPDDRARVIRRLKADNQSSAEHEEFRMEYFWAAVKDYKTWLQCLIYMGCDGSLYAFSLFLPTIISGLGKYGTVESQLLTIPPYAAATVCTIFVGWIADRTQQRGICNMASSLVGVVGFAMLLSGASPGVSYAGTFLGACGIYPAVANTIAWGSNNFEGVYKRGVAMGIFIGWGNLNGVVASNIYRTKDKPRYIPGHSVVLAYLMIACFGGSLLQYLILKRENAKRRAGGRDYWAEGKTHDEIELLGDKRPDFIYTL